MNNTPAKKPLFILSFFRTYWPLLMLVAALNWASHRDEITYWVGPTFYLLLLVVLCVATALFGKHLVYRRSLDAYTQQKNRDGRYAFVWDFWELDKVHRVWIVIVVNCVFFLGSCLIAASVAK